MSETKISKSELVLLLANRMQTKLKEIIDEDSDGDVDMEVTRELAAWLVDSGHVTHETMFSVGAPK